MTLRWKEMLNREGVDVCIDFRLNGLRRFFAEGFLESAWWIAELQLANTSIYKLEELAKEYVPGTLMIPNLYDEADRSCSPKTQYVTVYAQHKFLDFVNSASGREKFGVSRLELGSIVPDWQLDFSPDSNSIPKVYVADGTVVTAVIDNGIAFANNLFRKSDPEKSRVEFAWIMDAKPAAVGGQATQGRQLDKAEIDFHLNRNIHDGLLDEEEFYRETGLIDYAVPGFKPASQRVSHGTHVMGLAAGFDPADAAPPKPRPIVCVQLPTDVTMDVTGGDLTPSLGLAIDFILKRVSRFRILGRKGKRPPLVVNFSYGNFSGPHDGTGVIEDMLDKKLASTHKYKRRVALPAGNGNLSRTHATIDFNTAGNEVELHWRLQPDDHTASFVQFWMPYRNPVPELLELRVTPPGGTESGPVKTLPGSTQILHSGAEIVGTASYEFRAHPTMRGLISICVAPSANRTTANGLAPSGVWKIRVNNIGVQEGELVQVWIKRDETLPNFPMFGRQSYFESELYERVGPFGAPLPTDPAVPPWSGCLIKRAGTLSGFACGKVPAVIAGLVKSNGKLADYSAAGPITPKRNKPQPNRDGPDAAAVSDDSPVLHGVFSAGTRSGSIAAMRGTSVAAPRVARWIACQLEVNAAGGGDRAAVRKLGQIDDGEYPPPKPSVERTGGGRIKLASPIGSNRKA